VEKEAKWRLGFKKIDVLTLWAVINRVPAYHQLITFA
jgi:hypothetical protein